MVLESAKNGDIANINEHIATSARRFIFGCLQKLRIPYHRICPHVRARPFGHLSICIAFSMVMFDSLDGSESPRMGSTPLTANIHKASSKPTAVAIPSSPGPCRAVSSTRRTTNAPCSAARTACCRASGCGCQASRRPRRWARRRPLCGTCSRGRVGWENWGKHRNWNGKLL